MQTTDKWESNVFAKKYKAKNEATHKALKEKVGANLKTSRKLK